MLRISEMESDKHFCEIFEVNPEWVFELTGRPSPGLCHFVSMTMKAIERRCDGVLVPESESQPISIVELQMQFERSVYGRLVIEMALMQSERPNRSVEGMIIFGAQEPDPQTEPWRRVVSTYYLDELIEQLSKRKPEHPLVAVFMPLVEKNRCLLESNAAKYYNQIKSNTSDERQKENLLLVFVDWMMQRFSELGKKEIENMLLGELPDLKDTQAGKDLIALGIREGIQQGIEKGIDKGIEQGVEKGTLSGTIRTCQLVLGIEQMTESFLLEKSMKELSDLSIQLQNAVSSRFGKN